MPDQVRVILGVALLGAALVVGYLGFTENDPGTDDPAGAAASAPGDFDYYVLALSWSPGYCEEAGEKADRRQCASDRPYHFIVHGLWPQHEQGYPADCPTERARVPDALVDEMLDLMPAPALIGHEWRKHGTCTGLTQNEYFTQTRRARERVTIPERFERLAAYTMVDPQDVENAFLAANPGLTDEMVRVTCSDRYLREVRVCMTKDLAFRACAPDASRDCERPKLVMPPVRQGKP
ncbi:MAG: ribonuclease [Alphaproteobacteria bacterium]|nr:ribonuclease [Alphaproteobacteria bacterium]